MYQLTTQYDKPLSIALDYDDTFTAHREFWTSFIRLADHFKLKVTFVTYRHQTGNNKDILADAEHLCIPVIFSNGEPKSSVFKADIWIDDQPITIPSYEGMLDMLQRGGIE